MMCGRLNIIADPLNQWVSDALGLTFASQQQQDLHPTQSLDIVTLEEGLMHQRSATWGIKPSWSKALIINAQQETAAHKKTFAKAYKTARCIIPCSGWYEWSSGTNTAKQKYLFRHVSDRPLFMAGIQFFNESANRQVVTLTTSANQLCADYHPRMPFLLPSKWVPHWLSANDTQQSNFNDFMGGWLRVDAIAASQISNVT
ncbi:SOS response-associated peptidase [Shewanella colwelliana]|nr:SOS response-associated peptidase family protein [Shewanella colwelliana]